MTQDLRLFTVFKKIVCVVARVFKKDQKMREALPIEESQDIDRIAEGIARFAQIMLSQKIEREARELGMDAPAKEYLYEKTCSLLFGDVN